MAKNRRQIEDEILRNEALGDEEDYEEYARLRDAREGVRSRQMRIEQEEEARQRKEYEKRKTVCKGKRRPAGEKRRTGSELTIRKRERNPIRFSGSCSPC